MVKRNNNKNLNQIYSHPLPLTLSGEIYGPLPNLYPHNPVSWIYYGYKVWLIQFFKDVPQSKIPFIKVEFNVGNENEYKNDGIFKVSNEDDMLSLWRQGFFGKGNLSRSDPTWKSRINRRLNLIDENDENERSNEIKKTNDNTNNNKSDNGSGLSNEDITKLRREERKKFKNERSKLQELELKQRQQTINEEELKLLEDLKAKLNELKVINELNDESISNTFNFETLRIEDQKIIDPIKQSLYKNLEYVQLQPTEVFFLKFAINVIEINSISSIKELFITCCQQDIKVSNRLSQQNIKPSHETIQHDIKPGNKFIQDYIVYHHFRSLGWCVRSGIKFGCDMLLYKRGPPFSHAEYGIIIIPNYNQNNNKPTTIDHDDRIKQWVDIQAVSRVVGGVKKSFMFAFVDIPSQVDFDKVINGNYADEKEQFIKLFNLYKVTEVLYRRWVPSRTRD